MTAHTDTCDAEQWGEAGVWKHRAPVCTRSSHPTNVANPHSHSSDPYTPTGADAVVTFPHPVLAARTLRKLFCFFSN